MARQSLDSLLGNTVVNEAPPEPTQTTATPAGERLDAAKPPAARAAAPIEEPKTAPSHRDRIEDMALPMGEPKYLTLIRKETRLREEQYANLTEKSRQLTRAKAAGGERITENTLIRIAIDLLWTQVENLRGATEDELRKSVGL